MVADDFAYIRKRMYEIAVDNDTARANLEYTWSFHSPPQLEISEIDICAELRYRTKDMT